MIWNKGQLWKNICDLICEKGSLLKHLQKQFYIHIVIICTTIHSDCLYTKLFTRRLTVVSFYKSGHKHTYIYTVYYCSGCLFLDCI